jgi:N-acetylmuramoyl-L-alanine amidase
MIAASRHRRTFRRTSIGIAATASAAFLWAGCTPAQPAIINYAGHFRANPTARIHPTGIVLHWWGGTSGGRGINALVDTLNRVGGSVQLGTLQDGRTYQLTNRYDFFAQQAACANISTIGNEIEGGGNGTSSDMINDVRQFNAVVDSTAYLMRKYNIPLNGPIYGDRNLVIGVHSHKEVDAKCPRGNGKIDVDDPYMNKVRAALRARGF